MCAQLGSFVTFVLNYVPAVEKTLALWTQSILHLIFIQCFTTRNDVAGINNKLRSCGLSIRQYSFQRFCSPCAVYIKLPINWKRASQATSCQQSVWSYVGSTSIGVVARENNRRAKLKQTMAGQFVQVEPAIRFWATKGNYHQFTIIVLATFDDYRSAWRSPDCIAMVSHVMLVT